MKRCSCSQIITLIQTKQYLDNIFSHEIDKDRLRGNGINEPFFFFGHGECENSCILPGRHFGNIRQTFECV